MQGKAVGESCREGGPIVPLQGHEVAVRRQIDEKRRPVSRAKRINPINSPKFVIAQALLCVRLSKKNDAKSNSESLSHSKCLFSLRWRLSRLRNLR